MTSFLINKIYCNRNSIVSAFIDTKTKEKQVFEISDRINQYKEIIDKITSKHTIIIGYESYNYDNIIYNFLIDNYYIFLTSNAATIYTDTFYTLIKLERGEDLAELRSKKFFNCIDLKNMLFSKENRLSLEEIQYSIGYSTISNFKSNKDSYIKDITALRKLVASDCGSIAKIFSNAKEYLKLRLWIYKNINIDCLTLDNVTSGSLILGKRYCQAVGISYESFRNTKRYFVPVNIEEIILPFIKYETEEFNCALSSLKGFTIVEKSKYPSIPIVLKGKKMTLTGGGLHLSSTFVKKEDEIYISADCISQYPSMIHNHKLLDPTFEEVFLDIYHEAFICKEDSGNDDIKREFFKIILNSYYGCLLNEYKPFFCPQIAFKTTINCQLSMLMLAERLLLNDINIVALNTDSIDVSIKKHQEELYYQIINEWMNITKFNMTFKIANRVFRKDCNSYIMELTDGTIITRGDYNIENNFGKLHNCFVSKLAAVNRIMYNIPVEETIVNHDNPLDYCMFYIGDLYINDKKQQNSCRYYASRKGGPLYTKKAHGISFISKIFVKTANTKNEISEIKKNVNYDFYISKANKLVDAILPQQKTLQF